MKIRKATAADAAVIVDYNIRLAEESEGLHLELDVVTKGVTALLADPAKGIYFVAETPDAGVVGQLMITYEWSDWRNGNIWWLQSVYVHPEFRRRGAFKALFENLVALAEKSQEVSSLRLYMEKHNEQARRAYHKLGMKELDYQVLELPLSEAAKAQFLRGEVGG
jgi:ribosomal protein S18 acetylase RimI-like enzyme